MTLSLLRADYVVSTRYTVYIVSLLVFMLTFSSIINRLET